MKTRIATRVGMKMIVVLVGVWLVTLTGVSFLFIEAYEGAVESVMGSLVDVTDSFLVPGIMMTMEDGHTDGLTDGLDEVLEKVAERPEVKTVAIFDRSGRESHLAGCQSSDCIESSGVTGLMTAVLEGEAVVSELPYDRFVTLVPIQNEKDCQTCHRDDPPVLGALGVYFEGSYPRTLALATARRFILPVLVVFAVLFIAAELLVSVWLIAPIGRLTKVAEKLREGDLGARVKLRRHDEIGELAMAFNEMADKMCTYMEDLERMTLDLETVIQRLGDTIKSSFDRKELAKVILDEAMRITGIPQGIFYLSDGEVMSAVAWRGLEGDTILDHFSKPPPKEAVARLFEMQDVVRWQSVPDGSIEADLALDSGIPMIGIPVFMDQEFGVIVLIGKTASEIGETKIRLLKSLASEGGAGLVKCKDHEELARLAVTDPHTGLDNYFHFIDLLERELKRSLRYSYPVSLVIIDIDNFKLVNDNYGHLVGDDVLIRVAKILLRTTRVTDVCARYGGDEFAVIMPESRPEEAFAVAERIRDQIAGTAFPYGRHGGGVRVTVSIGVAASPDHAQSCDDLIRAADDAMYVAKRVGKNHVRMIGEEESLDRFLKPSSRRGDDFTGSDRQSEETVAGG